MNRPHSHDGLPHGGLARYFSERREVSCFLLIATLVWGWWAYTRLGQQEDPKIPTRFALLVAHYPGATSDKVEDLVTIPLEKKTAEMDSVEEIRSESRYGVSIIHVILRPDTASVEQEWDKLRARLAVVPLPEGCGPAFLDTAFGDTVALVLAVTSPPRSEAEMEARAAQVRERISRVRMGAEPGRRVAVAEFFSSSVPEAFRRRLLQQCQAFILREGLGSDPRSALGPSLALVDFRSALGREEIAAALSRFLDEELGIEERRMPDMEAPWILCGDEDPGVKQQEHTPPLYTLRELEKAAEQLESRLRQLGSVGRVRLLGVVPERVVLSFSQQDQLAYPLSVSQVAQAIRVRNAIIPGGVLQTAGADHPVRLSGEYRSESDLSGTVLGVSPTGAPIYLRDLLEVRRGYAEPLPMTVTAFARGRHGDRLEQRRSVQLTVEMKAGQRIADFDAEVTAAIHSLRPLLPEGVEVLRLSDQPRAVQDKIGSFARSFAEAVGIVVLVCLLLMDWRSSIVVATAIPLTVALTLGGMQILGMPLHQISIAALIIALGMLVDDPVVAADGINRAIAGGSSPAVGSWLGPYNLRRPIFFATLINIFAFLPMILLPGDVGAFVVALPVVVTLALVASRLVSMTFIPFLGQYVLRGQKGFEEGGEVRSLPPFRWVDQALARLLPRYRALLGWSLQHPWRVVATAYGMLLLSFGLVPLFGTQFFPSADRDQFLVDIEQAPLTSRTRTRQAAEQVMTAIAQNQEVVSAALYEGGSAPRFYYNVEPKIEGAHLAQVLVNTRNPASASTAIAQLREQLDREVPGARIVVKPLEQGPPIGAPIQVRVRGEDLDRIRSLSDQVAAVLRTHGGYKVHDDLGHRQPQLQLVIDQERANTLGISNAQIGQVSQAALQGLPLTDLREGDHLVPVVLRMRAGERNSASRLGQLYAESPTGALLPFSSFATVQLADDYPSRGRFNQQRAATVRAWAPTGVLPSAILAQARPDLERIQVPPGYEIDLAGEDKEMAKSAADMTAVMAVSLALIAVTMILQFGSAVKSLAVMLTVPLGLVGGFVGLALRGSSFGFMAMLAVVSLAGVIVSHIIVLSDYIEESRERGLPLEDALIQAGLVRLRPVLVTVLATVGGLVPLALEGGSLWEALTAVHIFGLLGATALTLLALPVLYFIFARRLRWIA